MKKHLIALLSVGFILGLPSCKNEEKKETQTHIETTEQKTEEAPATQVDSEQTTEVSSTENQVEKF